MIERLGARSRKTAISPKGRLPSTRVTCRPCSLRMDIATLTATVVVPTPPFGLNTAMIWPSRTGSSGMPCGDVAWLLLVVDRAGEHPAGHGALMHLADGPHDLLPGGGLQHELPRARDHRLAQRVRGSIIRNHDHPGAREQRGDQLRGLDAAATRQVHIHQHHIRPVLAHQIRWPRRRRWCIRPPPWWPRRRARRVSLLEELGSLSAMITVILLGPFTFSYLPGVSTGVGIGVRVGKGVPKGYGTPFHRRAVGGALHQRAWGSGSSRAPQGWSAGPSRGS